MSSKRWQFHIDRGGTFTDCIGFDSSTGRRHVAKVLSSDDAPLIGIRRILSLEPSAPIPPCVVRMGTTVATNALLERKGAATLLVITKGFRDLLAIGTQARPDIFALDIRKPEPLYREVLEVASRAAADGAVLERAERAEVVTALRAARQRGLESVALAVLHAYRAPQLELELADWARSAGFTHVTLSHQVSHEIGFLRRAQTAVLDAYLTPLLQAYLEQLASSLPGSELLFMQSSGDLAAPQHFRGAMSVLSGPAGGVVASAAMARAAGCNSAVGFDMGGTSTDVSRFDGAYARSYEAKVAGIDIAAPMLAIHTIAAGGGSLCRYDGHTLSVGPESAGAVPGPLCYGHSAAHELTLTDINLLLGRLRPERFPFPLHTAPATQALAALKARLHADGQALSTDEIAAGFLAIANESMAEAVRKVTLECGHDVREDALIVFGGAGGQHACAVARRLGLRRIVFPPFSSVLSAYGMGLAEQGWHGEQDVGRPRLSEQALQDAEVAYQTLESEARRVLGAAGPVEIQRSVDLRYFGSDTSLSLTYGSAADLAERFELKHRERFSFAAPEQAIVIALLRVQARVPNPAPALAAPLPRGSGEPTPLHYARVFCEATFIDDVPVYSRETLPPGVTLEGPVCIIENEGTIVVDPGFSVQVEPSGILDVRLTAVAEAGSQVTDFAQADPITLRLMGNAFMGIAEEMGALLRQTARSTNIRERLDFSCALFDADAQLIANAPHIPVHLGAMSESVRAVARAFPMPNEGDAFITNDPAEGGSHLPDITVVTPVFERGTLRFFTASRGHHVDVGGITPGSMPAFSQRLEEEGVVFSSERIVNAGLFLRDWLRERLLSGPFPARCPEQNLADIEAQIACNQLGARRLQDLLRTRGHDLVLAYTQHLYNDAARWTREMLSSFGNRQFEFRDQLDDGTLLAVHLETHDGKLRVEFECGPEQTGNSNAPRAVSVAALMYVLRCIAPKALPLNAGCLADVELHIPEPSVLHPSPGRAVVSGNVETSQRVVDVLLGALGKAAASQGTMNNLTFGNAEFAYYETLGGGAGAGPGFAGQSGTQCHMTNTRITDVEVLEALYPVRVVRFELRRGSGGAGRFMGGDGLVREFQFLRPVELSIISERRTTEPFGLGGGGAGAKGLNLLDGEELPGRYAGSVKSGGILRVETPGGGGYGAS